MTTPETGEGAAAGTRPAAGSLGERRVVVTRPVDRADTLCDLLSSRGAVAIQMPLVRVVPPASWSDLDEALRCLEKYDWIVFTSVNGVTAVLDRLDWLELSAEAFRATQVAAVGPATRRALTAAGVTAKAVPTEYRGEHVAGVLGPVAGRRVLLARAEAATTDLPRTLTESGAEVHDVAAYRTVPVEPGPTEAQVVHAGVDAITFTSPSAVRSFVAGFGDAASCVLSRSTVATIGPTTSAMARDLGIPVHVEATEHTMEGLVDALQGHFAARTGAPGSKEPGERM